MGGSKSEEFLAKASVGGHLRPVHDLRLRRERRGGPGARPPRRRTTTRRRPRRADARDAHDRHARQPPQRGVPARGPPWHAGDTLKNVLVTSSTPTAAVSRSRSASPATARSTRSASRGSWSRSRSSPSTRSSSKAPEPGQGLHRPRRPGRRTSPASATSWTPRRRGTRWVTGADVDGSHVIDLVAGRDFTPTARSRPPRSATATRAPAATAASSSTARGIEMGHIFQLGRKYADALDLKGARRGSASSSRSPWAPTASARRGGRRDRREHPRRAGPGVAAGGRPGRRAPGRDRQDEHVHAAADRIAHELDKRGIDGPLRRPRQGQPE